MRALLLLLGLNEFLTICNTGYNMWLELWEKLRGYDHWIEARATIETSLSAQGAQEAALCGDMLVWTDERGQRQAAEFLVPDDCTLYQKVSGDTLLIRYNPRKPGQFYHRQLHRVRVRTTIKRVAITVFLIALIVMAFWVRQKH